MTGDCDAVGGGEGVAESFVVALGTGELLRDAEGLSPLLLLLLLELLLLLMLLSLLFESLRFSLEEDRVAESRVVLATFGVGETSMKKAAGKKLFS